MVDVDDMWDDEEDNMLIKQAETIWDLREENGKLQAKCEAIYDELLEARHLLQAEHEQARKDVFYVADLLHEVKTLRAAMHDIYEVYAGSEGVPFPVTCPEAYLYGLVMEMADIAAKHKRHGIRDTETPSSCLVGGAERMRVAAIKEDQ